MTATDCWAVGFTVVVDSGQTSGTTHALMEHYSGGEWQTTISPSVGHLTGVACVSSRDCWAVRGPLIEHFTGNGWSLIHNPSLGDLRAITCVSASDCWAVGEVDSTTQATDYQTLIEHYTGNEWAVISSPSPTNASTVGPSVHQNETLKGVSCPRADNCWAVVWTTAATASRWLSTSTAPNGLWQLTFRAVTRGTFPLWAVPASPTVGRSVKHRALPAE